MFAPPPIQLSRDEIQSRLSEEAKNQSPDGEARAASLLRTPTQSPISPRRNHYFGKGDKLQVSSPIGPGSQSRFQHRNDLARMENTARADIEHLYTLPPGFGEHPRQAPTPPRRPSTRPPDLRYPLISKPFKSSGAARPVAPKRPGIAPPIPHESLKRRSLTVDQKNAAPLVTSPVSAVEKVGLAGGNTTGREHVYWQSRLHRTHKGIRFPGIEQQLSATWPTPTGAGIQAGIISSANDREIVADATVGIARNHGVNIRMEGPGTPNRPYSAQELQFLHKTLPETPETKSVTPTELYQSLESYQLSPSKGQCVRKKRTSPTILPVSNAEKFPSPGRLSAIPEAPSVFERPTSISDSCTPAATQWHLRGGSVVTVIPPESTPWVRYVYTQGPIRLQPPSSMPKKHSVASLEPFQDAIDGFHSDALHVPRRRHSDDHVLDDMCNFFDSFGFDSISYAGDTLVWADMAGEGTAESTDGAENEIERFSTPPAEPGLLSEEEGTGGDIAEATRAALVAQRHSIPAKMADGVPGADVANGAAYHEVSATPHSRKESATLTTESPFLR